MRVVCCFDGVCLVSSCLPKFLGVDDVWKLVSVFCITLGVDDGGCKAMDLVYDF